MWAFIAVSEARRKHLQPGLFAGCAALIYGGVRHPSGGEKFSKDKEGPPLLFRAFAHPKGGGRAFLPPQSLAFFLNFSVLRRGRGITWRGINFCFLGRPKGGFFCSKGGKRNEGGGGNPFFFGPHAPIAPSQ